MNLSRRASYVTMIVGALVAWADIDTARIAATTFGLMLLVGGAVVATFAHVVERRRISAGAASPVAGSGALPTSP